MSLDFSFKKYKEILNAISDSSYKVISIRELILNNKLPQKFIAIRHDVDLDPYFQIKYAELENDYNIHSSYYFRFIDKVFKKEVIDKVQGLGHEVGYHYEVFTKANGDENRAIELFREELNVFQENWKTNTVCPHGGSFVHNTDGYSLKGIIKLMPKLFSRQKVFSSWTNFDIWDKYKFEEFNILGDAYRSVNFCDILYLSDTGRSWDNKYKRLDKVDSLINPKFPVKNSDEIIRIIKNESVDKIYLLVHFEQWKDNLSDWISWYIAQLIRRSGKKILFGRNNGANNIK